MNSSRAWYDLQAWVDTLQVEGEAVRGRDVNPSALAVGPGGDVYVADSRHGRVMKRSAETGLWAVLTGSEPGQRNGWLSQAQFGEISALVAAPDGSLYVADHWWRERVYMDTIRVVRCNRVSTAVGKFRRVGNDQSHHSVGPAAGVRLHEVEGLEWTRGGRVLAAVAGQGRVVEVSPVGQVSNFIGHDPAQFHNRPPLWGPFDVKTHAVLGVVLCESCNLVSTCADDDRLVRVLAGRWEGGDAKGGHRDGEMSQALFDYPTGLAVGGNGHIYVADKDNHAIRAIVPGVGVFTVAGTGTCGQHDGPATEATFAWPDKIVIDCDSSLLCTERGSNVIRRVQFRHRGAHLSSSVPGCALVSS